MDRQSLGRYTIVEKIGAGGRGIVYKARNPRLKRDVAIKVLPPEAAADGSVARGSSRKRRPPPR